MENHFHHHHPSLPSNYVTITQLQERWLKQHQKQQQLQQQPPKRNQKCQNDNQAHGPHDRGDGAYVVPTRGTAFRASFGRQNRNMQAKYIPKIRTDSGTKNATGEKHRQSELKAGNGDGNSDLNDSMNEKNKKNKKNRNNARRKSRVEERGTSEGAAEEAKSKVKNEKEVKGSEVMEVTIKSEVKKEKEKIEESETAIEAELNEKKKVDSKLDEVEGKIRGLSINPMNGKQNEGLRVRDDFRYTQFQRSSYHYRNGYGNRNRNFGGGFCSRRYEVKEVRAEKMVWVRKDNNVGGIERET